MVLVRNFSTKQQRNDKLKKSIESLELEVKNAEAYSHPAKYEVMEIKKPSVEGLLINEEQGQELDSRSKSEQIAKKNLLRLTDEANATKIIEQLNAKNTEYIKYLNIAFPGIEHTLKKNYTNITAQFFVNYAISEIDKLYTKENKLDAHIAEDDDQLPQAPLPPFVRPEREVDPPVTEGDVDGVECDISYQFRRIPKGTRQLGKATGLIKILMAPKDRDLGDFESTICVQGVITKRRITFDVFNRDRTQSDPFTLATMQKFYPGLNFMTEELIEWLINRAKECKLDERAVEKRTVFGDGLYGASKGRQLKKGRGLSSDENLDESLLPKIPTKKNKWVAFGKYRLCITKLVDDDILSLQYPSGHNVNGLTANKVSRNFKLIIDDILNRKFNERLLKDLRDDELYLMEKVLKQSQVVPTYQSSFIDELNQRDTERFLVLKGQILAGNDSPELKRELKELIIRFIENGKISRAQSISLLAKF